MKNESFFFKHRVFKNLITAKKNQIMKYKNRNKKRNKTHCGETF